MTKDYKRNERRVAGRGGGHTLLVGILIGLVLGLGIALGVAWYINKVPSPFLSRPAPPAHTDKPVPSTSRSEEKSARPAESKPRFDFYKILPGVEEPATEQQLKEAQKAPASAKEAFFLQAGAFQSASDADNLKARLALLGIEATIQTTAVPDRGVWHRVRIGPYTSVERLNQTRDTLKHNGVETTLIKVREGR
ncbi:MAG TPA: SPOR domain-containing protein [Burkholderiales bacterium]|nr:SPOR domain-containing protein [Burkholderiales bacterium]